MGDVEQPMNVERPIDNKLPKIKPSDKAAVLADVLELGKVSSDVGEPTKEEKDKEHMNAKKRTLKDKIVQGVASLSIIVNVIAVAFRFDFATILAAIVAIPVAVLVILFQEKIRLESPIYETQNKIRHSANKLQTENNKLLAEVVVFEHEVKKLKRAQRKLDKVCETQGVSAQELLALVKRNSELLKKTKAACEHLTVQFLSRIAITSDGDCRGEFDDKKTDTMILQFKALPGVRFNEHRLRTHMAQTGRKLSAVLDLCRTILDESIPDHKKVFVFEPLDDDEMSSLDLNSESAATMSVASAEENRRVRKRNSSEKPPVAAAEVETAVDEKPCATKDKEEEHTEEIPLAIAHELQALAINEKPSTEKEENEELGTGLSTLLGRSEHEIVFNDN